MCYLGFTSFSCFLEYSKKLFDEVEAIFDLMNDSQLLNEHAKRMI